MRGLQKYNGLYHVVFHKLVLKYFSPLNQLLQIYLAYLQVTSPRELSGNMKVALVPRLRPGARLPLWTIETMMFFSESQITYTKNQSETHTLVVFHHNQSLPGQVMTSTEGLLGSQVEENGGRRDPVLVTCPPGTKICRKEWKFQFKRLKNLSHTSFKRGHLMVTTFCSSVLLFKTLLSSLFLVLCRTLVTMN